jgi:hypothetical protein
MNEQNDVRGKERSGNLGRNFGGNFGRPFDYWLFLLQQTQ